MSVYYKRWGNRCPPPGKQRLDFSSWMWSPPRDPNGDIETELKSLKSLWLFDRGRGSRELIPNGAGVGTPLGYTAIDPGGTDVEFRSFRGRKVADCEDNGQVIRWATQYDTSGAALTSSALIKFPLDNTTLAGIVGEDPSDFSFRATTFFGINAEFTFDHSTVSAGFHRMTITGSREEGVSTPEIYKLFLDGILVDTQTVGGFPGAGFEIEGLGNMNTTADRDRGVMMADFWLWDGVAMSEAAVLEHALRPYDIFLPEIIDIGASGGASGQTKTVSLNALLQQAQSKTTILNAALQTEQSKTATLNAVVTSAVEKTVTLNGVVQEAISKTASLNAAVQAAKSATANLNAQIQDEESVTATLNAAIQAEQSATASLNAAVQKAQSLTTSLNAVLALPGSEEKSVTATLNGVLQKAQEATASLSGAIQDTIALTATLNGVLVSGGVLTATLNGVLLANRTATVSLNGIVQQAQSATATLNAAVAIARSVTATLNAIVQKADQPLTVTLNSLVKGELTMTVSLNAILSAQGNPAAGNRTFIPRGDRSFSVRGG